ncbi:transcriptional regulator domain-containing protein [Sphingomonas koreensis]|uniref:transcriptional regulator domain-containing protein n=1 Tax=Sphingomonas koreensis TaxID=93064 RepID=UPI0035E3F5BD
MWEWLRRDPAYVAWYTSASGATRNSGGRADPLRWCLHFRRRSEPPGARGACHLGCECRSRDALRRRTTARR